jgi:hypothetical protein
MMEARQKLMWARHRNYLIVSVSLANVMCWFEALNVTTERMLGQPSKQQRESRHSLKAATI